jgi:hypothetical protein
MIQAKTRTYYKYRSLENFKHFIDIILNNRLYAANFKKLNDPMEGLFYYWIEEEEVANEVMNQKYSWGICSLGKTATNELLWERYADNHKGIAIEVTLKKPIPRDIIIEEIKYRPINKIKRDVKSINGDNIAEHAKSILLRKTDCWEDEDEVRILIKDENFVNIEIKKIIIGRKVIESDKDLIKCLVDSRAGLDKNIIIIKQEE